MKTPFRKMWDSMVRFGFAAPSTDKNKNTEDEHEKDSPPAPAPRRKPKPQKRLTDAHVFSTAVPPQHQPHAAPALLAQKGKSEPAHPVISYPHPDADPAPRPAPSTTPPTSSPSNTSPSLPHPPSSPSLPPLSPAPPTTTMPLHLPPYPDPDPIASTFLSPLRVELNALRLTTAHAIPPPGMRVHFKIKTHVQLVRERLLPVGAFIVEQARGDAGLEMRVCYHIAAHYWPLPAVPGEQTHLRVHEMYRNALYTRAQISLRDADAAPAPAAQDPDDDDDDDMPGLEPATPFDDASRMEVRRSTMSFVERLRQNRSTRDDADDDEEKV